MILVGKFENLYDTALFLHYALKELLSRTSWKLFSTHHDRNKGKKLVKRVLQNYQIKRKQINSIWIWIPS